MGFETPEINPALENTIEQENTIENTASFQEAITLGNLEDAEKWLMKNKERGDARWLDHRSRELFKAHREAGDFVSAKKMVEFGNGEAAIKGRKSILEKEAGILYDEI